MVLGADGAPQLSAISHAELSSAATALGGLAEVPRGGRLGVALSPFSESFALEIALGLAAGATLTLPPAQTRVDEVLVESLRDARASDAALAAPGALAELRAAGGKLPPLVMVFGAAPAELKAELSAETTRVIYLRTLQTSRFVLLSERPAPQSPSGVTNTALSGGLVGPAAGVVLDPHGQATPLGVVGELYEDFFGHRQATGVRARRVATGAIEIAPTSHEELCFAGHRFDGRAVARAIALLPTVADAYVTVEAAGDAERLICYVEPREGQSFTETELRRQARAVLPGALVPQLFQELTQLPRDATGQVERSKLPSPFAAPKLAYVAPRTPSEKLLAQLFIEVLGLPRVGVHDNFFDLGGQSLLCLRVVDMIEKQTKRRLSPRILLLNTLEQAANALDQLGGETAGAQPPRPTAAAEAAGVAGRVLKGLRGLLGGG